LGFTGGYALTDDWLGNGVTPNHWRDTNVRIEGPAVRYLQAAFTESWLETTGNLLGGEGIFPDLNPAAELRCSSSKAPLSAGASELHSLLVGLLLGRKDRF
jgi:cardiolipin synthase